jgi:hypothetical protein
MELEKLLVRGCDCTCNAVQQAVGNRSPELVAISFKALVRAEVFHWLGNITAAVDCPGDVRVVHG